MHSVARRLRVDLRRVRVWALLLAPAVVLMAFAATYQAAFAADASRSTRLDSDSEMRSGIRMIDPGSSMVNSYEDSEQLHASAFDQPGLGVLLDHMTGRPGMYLTTPLGTLTQQATGLFQNVSSDAVAVIGEGHQFLPDSDPHSALTLWGSISADYAAFPAVTDRQIGSIPMTQLSVDPPRVTYVDGSGRRRLTQARPVVLVRPAAAAELGAPLTDASDLIGGFVCECSVDQLQMLTFQMNAAEAQAHTSRRFYAVSHSELRTALQKSYALGTVLTTAFAAATVLGLLIFAFAAAEVFWDRNRAAYQVEMMHGAGGGALQARQQVLLGLSVTVPLLVGFGAGNGAIAPDGIPARLPAGAWLLPLASALALHGAVGFINRARAADLEPLRAKGPADG